MNLLALDTTARAASAALFRDGVLLAEFFAEGGRTHSEIILPMAENVCARAHIALSKIDFYAVSAGPGSFTGVRIGAATVKGLAFRTDAALRNCVGVSTLEAIARSLAPLDGIYAAVMDARRGEVYNALFRMKDGVLTRLCPDRAISLTALGEELLTLYHGESVRLAGDGYEVARAYLSALPLALPETPLRLRTQNASAVGLCALDALARDEAVTADALKPIYLRVPQAERDLLKKQQNKE
ncbi:MAG: tRNA (adenosine(37)-N6)-threonylcarbamoyltransferase complex dimerization subunit type 1 TsaB [Clostridia bacterium]|nr:tRNA (adenosine(37)-N6)-threonylcarbamoyltransferase complex dimerization subunit type 1 TsaB [Clostridia bacterium]